MNIPSTIFREYDIRGLVDRDLTPEVVTAIHRAYATFLQRHDLGTTAIVARDSRSYNEAVQTQAIAALRASGINVIDIGVVTAPAFYFSQVYLKVIPGSVVTASHNPHGWSGFKQLVGPIQTATVKEIQEIQDIITKEDFVRGAKEGSYERRDDVVSAYTADIAKRITIVRPLKVVVDCGGETSSLMNPSIMRLLGLEVIEQCSVVGAPAVHEPNPSTLEALAHLSEGVRRAHADVGVGFDADGDRFGIVDEHGEAIWPDRVAMVAARDILARYPGGSVVFDVKCTQALVDTIHASGGKPVMWRTGHSWIRRKSQEISAVLAAERSGHFYFPRDHHGYDDGLFSALKFLELLSKQSKSASDFLAEFPKYETSPVWHAPCGDGVKYAIVDQLTKALKDTYGVSNVIDINGARVQFDDGWGLVRASSNVPALVLVFEGKTIAARDRIEKTFRELLRHYPDVGTQWQSG